MTRITCRLTAENRDQLRNPTLRNRIWAASLLGSQHIETNANSFLSPVTAKKGSSQWVIFMAGVCALSFFQYYLTNLMFDRNGQRFSFRTNVERKPGYCG